MDIIITRNSFRNIPSYLPTMNALRLPKPQYSLLTAIFVNIYTYIS